MTDNIEAMPQTENYAIATGNPFDGLTLIGPFTSFEEAVDYAESTDTEYNIVILEKPKLETA